MAAQTNDKPVFVNSIVTPIGTLSFPHLNKPDEGRRYSDGKYKATLLLPKKGVDLGPLKNAVLMCAKKKWPKVTKLDDIIHPFRDGDLKDVDGYKGCVYIACKSKRRPALVGKMKEEVDGDHFYGGCKARFIVSAMTYMQAGKPGVTLLLDAVQFAGEGERLGGGCAQVDAFDEIDDGSDNPENYAEPDAGEAASTSGFLE
jgi:hypothetical protein